MKLDAHLNPCTAVLLLLAMAVILLPPAPALPADHDTDPGHAIRFNWAFGAWVQTDNGRELIRVDKDMPLRTGDRLKFFLQPLSSCHIYLIYHGSRDEMHLLFPIDRHASLQDQDLQVPHLIPKGFGWFSIDSHPGLERFYLLASDKPLAELENLLGRLNRDDAVDQGRIIQEIRAEIKRLKRLHRKLSATAERPISIGGSIRGSEPDAADANPDVKKLATQISAPQFFSRTFTIEHP